MYVFAICTHNGLYMCELERDYSVKFMTRLDDGYYYGATSKIEESGSISLFAYRGGPGKEKILPREIKKWIWTGGEAYLESVYPLYDSAGDVHQICMLDTDKFALANTENNSVDIWSSRSGLLQSIAIGSERLDTNHINSIFSVGEVMLVMLHNLRKQESQIEVYKVSGKNEYEKLGVKSLADYCCHNIGLLGSKMFVNASGVQALVKIDAKTMTEDKRIKFKEHTKGLACADDLIFSGMSDCAARSDRVNSNGWVNIVGSKNMKLIKSIKLFEEGVGEKIGNINEIRLLNKEDAFDQYPKVDESLVRGIASVEQSKSRIYLNRFKIVLIDKLRRTIRKVVT